MAPRRLRTTRRKPFCHRKTISTFAAEARDGTFTVPRTRTRCRLELRVAPSGRAAPRGSNVFFRGFQAGGCRQFRIAARLIFRALEV